MKNKHLRGRNTLSNFIGFFPNEKQKNNNSFLTIHDRNIIMLQLLEKHSEKILKNQINSINDFIQKQNDTNSILATIDEQSIRRIKQMNQAGSIKMLNTSINSQKSSQNLISSWAALQKLDINYKVKEQDLIKQNKQLHLKVNILEEKLRSLHQAPMKKSEQSRIKKDNNTVFIQKRISKHSVLIQKIKKKIEKKLKEKEKFNILLQKFVRQCQNKFGQDVVTSIKKKLQNFQQYSI